MIEKEEYLTVKEFADRAGISVQAVYQRLNKDLKPFLKLFKGKKTLNSKGLELFSTTETFKAVEQDFKANFKSTLKSLNSQLDAKDKQINDLNERLGQALKLNENQQILLRNEQEKSVLLQHLVEEVEVEIKMIKGKNKSFFQRIFKSKG